MLSTLLLGTVLTGPAAQPARDRELTDPFGPSRVQRPTLAKADLLDPFAAPATATAQPAPSTGPAAARPAVRRARARATSDLRDPFSPDSAGEAAARRAVVQPSSPDLAGPFQGPSKGEAAAQRIVPLATPSPDLRDPFAG